MGIELVRVKAQQVGGKMLQRLQFPLIDVRAPQSSHFFIAMVLRLSTVTALRIAWRLLP